MPRKQTLIKGTKGKKDTEKEGKSKKAHLSYSLLLVHHHLLRAAFRLALDYQYLPCNTSSTSYNNPHFVFSPSDCLSLSREGLGWERV